MSKKAKIIILILSVLTLIFLSYFMHDKTSFPVTYNLCGLNYSDCSVVAKFDDMDSCENHKERAGWYCDTLDGPQNPSCEVKKSLIVTSYCSE